MSDGDWGQHESHDAAGSEVPLEVPKVHTGPPRGIVPSLQRQIVYLSIALLVCVSALTWTFISLNFEQKHRCTSGNAVRSVIRSNSNALIHLIEPALKTPQPETVKTFNTIEKLHAQNPNDPVLAFLFLAGKGSYGTHPKATARLRLFKSRLDQANELAAPQRC